MSNDLYIAVEQLRLGLARVENLVGQQLMARLAVIEQHVGIAGPPMPAAPPKPVPTGPPSAVQPSPPQPLTAQPISSPNPLASMIQSYVAEFLGQAAPVVQAFLAHSQGHPPGTVGPAGTPQVPHILPSGARATVKLPLSFPSQPPQPSHVPTAVHPSAVPGAPAAAPAAASPVVGAGELDWLAAEGVPPGQVAAAVRTTALPPNYRHPPGVSASPDPGLRVPMPQ